MKNGLLKLSFCKHTLKIRQDPTSDTSELVFVTLQYNLSQHQYHFANYLSLHSKFNSYHYLQKFYHVQCKHKNLYNWAYECSDMCTSRGRLWNCGLTDQLFLTGIVARLGAKAAPFSVPFSFCSGFHSFIMLSCRCHSHPSIYVSDYG